MTVPLMSPAFASTMPFRFIPRSSKNFADFSAGLINEARPDLSAFAPSEALMPPSRIAVKKNARSSMFPPSCLTTGAAFGIAIVKSDIAVIVWFSTAFKKSIFLARSAEAMPKALVKEIVVCRASCCSTSPRTASLVAFVTCSVRATPIRPIWAASAARARVFSTSMPYLVNSSASLRTSLKACSVSTPVVNSSP